MMLINFFTFIPPILFSFRRYIGSAYNYGGCQVMDTDDPSLLLESERA
ncbi:hypothetical protein CHCC14820_1537 [Bacillus paralicheniformis]|nr:hypothetical protein CHCC20347_3996 [Bacillus paralicheniformis]TWK81773.1 hypothetical protein CHCC20331_4246 [Bacillus paralicheniformis]TWL08509.1 hypothetical protein CHCC19467_3280 [Bacillus paralicheniformis]TWL11358.1 hypothetical protein CHCC19468_2192 [Bacillus paralicheniformis]TWL47006.1 hypothetical protein CHCC15337_0947 [Bacillus paralicheniformis]